MHFLRSTLPLALVWLLGCDDATTTDTTGTASTSSDASSGSTGSSSSSSGTGGMGGSPAYTPPPVKSACAAPTKGTIHELSGANMERYGSPALDWDGASAGLAYAITDGPDTWSIHFQPVGLDGSLGGADVYVANQQKTGLFPPRVAVAMGAGVAMVCNDNTNNGPELRCFAISGGASSLGLTVTGAQPALAFGAAGFALVYADAGKLWSQRLKTDATPDGAPHEVASSTSPDSAAPTLTATSDGYAALSSAWGLMWRFDGTFTELEGMAVAGWKDAPTAIAGSGALVGAVFGESSGVKFRRVEPDNTLGASVKIDAPMASSIYQYTAIARGASDTFAAVWSEYEGFIGYRAIDATGAPIGAAVDVLPSNWDDNAVAITSVSDGFLVASTVNPSADALSVVHLGCP